MTGVNKYLIKNGEGVKGKDADVKRRIIAQLATGDKPIADIAKAIEISIPTITKLIGELTAEGIIEDLGKVETAGGRRPNIFGLKDTKIHFLGAEITNGRIVMIVSDLRGRIITSEVKKFIGSPLDVLEQFARTNNAAAAGVCVERRIDPDEPIYRQIEERLGVPVYIDTITRARCHIEHIAVEACRNMLYADIGHTLTVGMVIDGALYYGHSGLGGELFNTPVMEGNIGDVIAAARRDDPRAIDLIEQAAEKAGRDIAAILNLLNPESVVVGGALAHAGDYLMLPLQAAIHKHTQKAVYRDTRFRLAEQNENSGAAGVANIIRNITLGIR